MRFFFNTTARRIGAVGLSHSIHVLVEADTLAAALLELYDTYEHVSYGGYVCKEDGVAHTILTALKEEECAKTACAAPTYCHVDTVPSKMDVLA